VLREVESRGGGWVCSDRGYQRRCRYRVAVSELYMGCGWAGGRLSCRGHGEEAEVVVAVLSIVVTGREMQGGG
jgi:hypothetical protein